jgi:hypothetical protein
MTIKYYKAITLRTVRTFRAPNPWNQGQAADWSLNEYALAPVGNVMGIQLDGTKPSPIHKTRSLGILSRPDGRHHLLPRSLATLSQNQQAPDDQLPALLREMEPTLQDVDFKHPNDRFFWIAGILLTAGALMIAGISIWAALQQLMGKAGLKVMLLFFVFFGFLGAVAARRILRSRQRTKQQLSELLVKLSAVRPNLARLY